MAPESMALAVKKASESPHRLDEAQTSKASSALLKHMYQSAQEKQRSAPTKSLLSGDLSSISDAESIWLVLSTKKHIVPQPRLKPGKILLPHSLNISPSLSICIIVPDPQRAFKDLVASPSFPTDLSKRITRVIDIKHLQRKYQSFESRRQLRDSYDIFLADDRIITYLSKILGKFFYTSTAKRPIPIRLAASKSKTEKKNAALPSTKPRKATEDPKSIATPQAAAAEINRTLSTTQVHLSPSATTSVRVGLSSQTHDQIAGNIKAVVETMTEKYIPRQWRGLQAIHVKGPNTMALPIWLASEMWEDESKVLGDHEADELHFRATVEGKNKKRKLLEPSSDLVSKADIFMSIKPEHIGDIVSGAKTYEFRRYLLPSSINYIWFYTTAPISAIQYVTRISRGKAPGELPGDGGLGNEDFNAGTKESIFGYEILMLWKLEQPITLDQAKSRGFLKGPPQKYNFVPNQVREEWPLENQTKLVQRQGIGDDSGRLAIENGATDSGSEKERTADAQQEKEKKKRKRKADEEDFSQEMKERREKLKAQKRKIQSSLDKSHSP